jgi:hypothetical protein
MECPSCDLNQVRVGCKQKGQIEDDSTCVGGCGAGFYTKYEYDASGDTRASFICSRWKEGEETKVPFAKTCEAGASLPKVTCISCPVDYYQPDILQDNCTRCETGRYNKRSASSFCRDSQPGMSLVHKADGTIDLQVCNVGRFSKGAAASCTDCPVGKFQSNEGSSACDVVNTGYARKSAKEQVKCTESKGVRCTGTEVIYSGSVWHDTAIGIPACGEDGKCTQLYTCVTNGMWRNERRRSKRE